MNRSVLRALVPAVLIFSVLYVPPLRGLYDSGVAAIGRAFGTSVTNVVDDLPTTNTTTTSLTP